MTTVQAKGWQAGEYKLCVTVSRKELKYPLLANIIPWPSDGRSERLLPQPILAGGRVRTTGKEALAVAEA
jgi:hypothetical protein